MTNLFAENKEIIRPLIPDGMGDPVLVDINNVYHYKKDKAKEENYFNYGDYSLNLPWPVSWFEYKAGNHTWGFLAIYDKESGKNTYNCFFTYDQIPGKIICLGCLEFLGGNFSFNNTYNLNSKISNHSEWLIRRSDFNKIKIEKMMRREAVTVHMATTFSGCSNIEYYEKSHPPKLQKANIKRGKTPQETYKVLNIGGLKKQAKSEAGENGDELRQALHICRGHFKTYTEENPLFGKHTGTYWWPMHTKGDAKNGKVNKDYKVHSN